MKQKFLFLSLWAMLAFANVQAQCDPWIVQAYKELYGRTPNANECNIRHYNNGSWNSYSELVMYIKKFNGQASATPANCDPWIQDIYKKEFGREPDATECNIKNYNNGSWNSYDELKGYIHQYKTIGTGQKINLSWTYSPSEVSGDIWIKEIYQELYGRAPNAWEYNTKNYVEGAWQNREQLKQAIQQYQNNVRNAGMFIDLYDLGNGRFVVDLKVNGKSTAVSLIEGKGGNVVAAGGANVVSAGGANVVSAGGANAVAAGGANVVAPGGANVVSAGGGNVIAPGGGNVVVNPKAAGFYPGKIYGVNSGARKIIRTSGRGAIVIK